MITHMMNHNRSLLFKVSTNTCFATIEIINHDGKAFSALLKVAIMIIVT